MNLKTLVVATLLCTLSPCFAANEQALTQVLKAEADFLKATRVYNSGEVKKGFDLSSLVADDTIHTTEFKYKPEKAKGPDFESIKIASSCIA